ALILIGVGLIMLWNRTHEGSNSWWGGSWVGMASARFRDRHEYSGNAVHEFAMFGGSKRIVTAQDFQGGTVSCVFGGVTLDLTGANIAGNSAHLNLSALYGGIVIRIPTSWSADVRGVGII